MVASGEPGELRFGRSLRFDPDKVGLSHPVFDGDFEARVCLAEGEVSAHGTCEEVFKGVAGPRDASGVRVWASYRARREGSRDRERDASQTRPADRSR